MAYSVNAIQILFLVTYCLEEQPVTWLQVNYIGPVSSWRRQFFFFFHKSRYLKDMDLLFQSFSNSSTNIMNWLIKLFRLVVPLSIAYDKEFYFTLKEES